MCVDTKPWKVSDYLTAAPLVGLKPSNFVPLSYRDQCAVVAQRNVPPGAPPTFVTVCTASLIVRGIVYFKCTPGDCGSPTQVNPGSQEEAQALGIGSQAAAALPGIGPFVNAIAGVFSGIIQHHALAVANEQKVICGVAGIVNQVFYYYDNLVRAGKISPSTAWAGMQTYLNQVAEQLSTIEKSCNASCVYTAIIKAHSDFVQGYYPAIAPVSYESHAPGAPPTALGTTPGGVIQVGGGIDSVTGLLAGGPGSSGVSGFAFLLIVAVIVALFVVASKA